MILENHRFSWWEKLVNGFRSRYVLELEARCYRQERQIMALWRSQLSSQGHVPPSFQELLLPDEEIHQEEDAHIKHRGKPRRRTFHDVRRALEAQGRKRAQEIEDEIHKRRRKKEAEQRTEEAHQRLKEDQKSA